CCAGADMQEEVTRYEQQDWRSLAQSCLSRSRPPTLQILLFELALDPEVQGLRLAIVDEVRTPESRELISAITTRPSPGARARRHAHPRRRRAERRQHERGVTRCWARGVLAASGRTGHDPHSPTRARPAGALAGALKPSTQRTQ